MKGKAQWEMVTKDAYRSTVISDQKLRMTETLIRIPSCGMCHDFEMISIALITNQNAQPKQKFISILIISIIQLFLF